MFEKTFSNGEKVVIENGVIAIYDANGDLITNSNVDYYYDEAGYGLFTEEEVADKFHEHFSNENA